MSFDIIWINHETWLVCGGRDFADDNMFHSAMGDLTRLKGMPERVIQGGANGADRMARGWAERHAVDLTTVLADWQRQGRAAGPIRNQTMLDDHKPDLIVAFPGGRGTADMVKRARKAGVDIAEIKPS